MELMQLIYVAIVCCRAYHATPRFLPYRFIHGTGHCLLASPVPSALFVGLSRGVSKMGSECWSLHPSCRRDTCMTRCFRKDTSKKGAPITDNGGYDHCTALALLDANKNARHFDMILRTPMSHLQVASVLPQQLERHFRSESMQPLPK